MFDVASVLMNMEAGTIHNRSQALSDATIRRCLLGCADPFEQANFETFLMLDDQFEKRVYLLELELTDDFSLGSLNEAEQWLFKTRFLVTGARQHGLAISQALVQSTSKWESQKEQISSHWRPAFLNLFTADHSLAGHAVAATSVVLLGFLFWLSLKVPPQRPTVISKSRPAVTAEMHNAHPVTTQSPGIKPSDDNNSPQSATVLKLPLQPDSSSASGQSLHIPGSVDEAATVRLELLVDNPANIYQARLTTEPGEPVTAFSELRLAADDPAKVILNVPAQLLKDGTYYIDLAWTSDSDIRSLRYTFQVIND
jgi:hypothetical protein